MAQRKKADNGRRKKSGVVFNFGHTLREKLERLRVGKAVQLGEATLVRVR